MTMNDIVFWDVAPCGSVLNRQFGETYRLHIQGMWIKLALMMEVIRSCETSVQTKAERCCIPKRLYSSSVTCTKFDYGKYDCADKGQQQLYMTDLFFRRRGRPTWTNPQFSDTNKNLVLGTRCGLTPRQNGWLPVSRNVTLILTST
jgi:hypothetical protein